MFPGNNIASVGVKLSCLHTEGVFTAVDTLHKQTQEQCTLYYFSVVSLSWMKWRLELICIVVLSYQRKNCFAWLDKYSQTESQSVESQDYYRSNVKVQIRSGKQNLRKIILFYLPDWGFWIRFCPTEVEKKFLSKLVQYKISFIDILFRPNIYKPVFCRLLVIMYNNCG